MTMPSIRLLVFICVAAAVVLVGAEETTTTRDAPNNDTAASFNAKEHLDWGTYYDPKEVFCGKYDCYKILGLDYEQYIESGSAPPDRKLITQRYRALSREWHPDKNKHKDAKNRFVKIAKAYEVLTDEKTRKDYDRMRYDPQLYLDTYGTNVLWEYAPKSDAILVTFLLLGLATLLSWHLQKQKWQQVANRLIRAAVEDWGPREGGTPESKQLRDKAMKILQEQEKNGNSTTTDDISPSKRKNKVKLTGTEKRKQLEDSLRPIITQLVDEMEDFGAGYHKPTIQRDLLLWKIARFPSYFVKGTWWNIKYFARRLQKKPLNDEERLVLTKRAVGDIAWESATEEERQDWVTRDLWVAANMVDWEEEQEIKFLSASEQKRYARMKKKGKKYDWGYDKEE